MGTPGGLHFGLDNHAAFDDAMTIVSKPYAETIPRKPWTLVKNCDLLELLHEASHRTDRKSIIWTWGKGHCTEDDVKSGKVSDSWFQGTGRSDTLAHKARETQGEWGDCDRYTAIDASRQRGYAKLLQQLFLQNARVFIKF